MHLKYAPTVARLDISSRSQIDFTHFLWIKQVSERARKIVVIRIIYGVYNNRKSLKEWKKLFIYMFCNVE